MFIQDVRRYAAQQISRAGAIPRRLVFISTGVALAAALLSALVGQLVGSYQGGDGLSGMGAAGILQTLNQSLSLVVQLLMPFWSVGVVAAILSVMRTGNGGMAELTVGIRRFPVFLRLQLLQGLLVTLIALVLSNPVTLLVTLFVPETAAAAPEELFGARMLPVILIYLALLLAVYVFLSYRLRLTNFHILGGCNSALTAMLLSAQQMKGKCRTLFRLDLSFWWYHVGNFLLVGICYLDMILQLMGKSLPWDGNTGFWVCYLLYAAGHLALETAARPWVEGANVCFFQAVCEVPPQQNPQ